MSKLFILAMSYLLQQPYPIALPEAQRFDRERLPLVVNGMDVREQDRLALRLAVEYWCEQFGDCPIVYGDEGTPGTFVQIKYEDDGKPLAVAFYSRATIIVYENMIARTLSGLPPWRVDKFKSIIYAHELGHLLGLAHLETPWGLMQANINFQHDELTVEQRGWLGIEVAQ